MEKNEMGKSAIEERGRAVRQLHWGGPRAGTSPLPVDNKECTAVQPRWDDRHFPRRRPNQSGTSWRLSRL